MLTSSTQSQRIVVTNMGKLQCRKKKEKAKAKRDDKGTNVKDENGEVERLSKPVDNDHGHKEKKEELKPSPARQF